MATQIKKINNSTKSTTVENKEIEKETNIKEENFDYRDKEIEMLKAENAEKDKKFEELSKNFMLMQEQFEKLMKQQFNNVPTNNSNDDEDVLVGCRSIYGNCLATSDGRYSYSFLCDEEKYIAAEDLKMIFRDGGINTRKMFEDDIFYFVNPEDYAKFKIKKRIDLSRENIIRILNLDTVQMIDEINTMTNNLLDFSIVHNFQFEVVKLLNDKSSPLANWKYENRAHLERYLRQKFDDLQAAVGALELIPKLKK